jgi:hypothetical protein
MLLIVFILSGCAGVPVSCECEMAAVRSERGEPDMVTEHKQKYLTMTVWKYFWQKAEYTFILDPTYCRVESIIRRPPGS